MSRSVQELFCSSSSQETQWGTELATIQKGVYVSRTVIPEKRLHDIPIRVVNVTDTPVHSRAGRKVAEWVAVAILEVQDGDREAAMKVRMTSETTTDAEGVPEFMKKLIEGVHPSLSEKHVEELKRILLNYQDVFSKSESDLGLTTIVKHRHDTGDAPPFRQQLRRFHPPMSRRFRSMSIRCYTKVSSNLHAALTPPTSCW